MTLIVYVVAALVACWLAVAGAIWVERRRQHRHVDAQLDEAMRLVDRLRR